MNFLYMLLDETADAAGETTSSNWMMIVIYIIIFAAIIYFLMIRPSKKQKKQQADTMNSMAIGDNVLTTAGMYGTIVGITGDTVVVEFGNNKNCRIPMSKQAISQVEKAGAAEAQPQNTVEAAAPTNRFARKKAEKEAAQAEAEAAKSEESEASKDETAEGNE